MEGISTELVKLLYNLLPGFVAAAVFYGLTAHARASPFERVVEALIFTVIVQAVMVVLREVLFLIGTRYPLGNWTVDSALVCSVLLAVVVGLLAARFANNNCIHEWLREWPWYDKQRAKRWLSWLPKWEWTCRTSFPSEWYSAFSREKRYIVLHLKGNRRLHGWPEEWPDQCDRGQFVIQEPKWLLDNGDTAPLYGVERMLIAVSDVEMVEFIKDPEELTAHEGEMAQVQKLMVHQQSKGEGHGCQSSDAAPKQDN